MVCSLVTRSAVDVHGQIITPGRTYSVSRYSVAEPGMGVHHRFHIRFDELTSVDVVPKPFVDRVFNLRGPAEVPASLMFVGNIYGEVLFFMFSQSLSYKYCHDKLLLLF